MAHDSDNPRTKKYSSIKTFFIFIEALVKKSYLLIFLILNFFFHSKKERKISERVDQLAKKFDFQYNSVIFKDMISRWGSCSYENNICLNKKLTLLPDRFRDCIILHELLHTKIKNHGSSFWSEFDRMIPNAKQLHREINKKYII